jgi:hypothetical protein
MSAFLLDVAHIDAILTAARDVGKMRRWPILYGGRVLEDEVLDVCGKALVSENHDSVNYRYATSDPPPRYAYRRRPGPALYDGDELAQCRRIAAAFKACDCYVYQSCEHPGWRSSSAKTFIESLISALAGALPGYDDAPWEITS